MNDHMHIARERFLELMAQKPGADVKMAAIMAIDQEDKFMAAYVQYGPKKEATDVVPRMKKEGKGCSACFGSGGPHGKPCKICSGTGRIPS